jgi:hypothetical protein
MSYGRMYEGECPQCGYEVEVIDYHADPPPIPMHVTADVHHRDSGGEPGTKYLECPCCGCDFQQLDWNPRTRRLEPIAGDRNGQPILRG